MFTDFKDEFSPTTVFTLAPTFIYNSPQVLARKELKTTTVIVNDDLESVLNELAELGIEGFECNTPTRYVFKMKFNNNLTNESVFKICQIKGIVDCIAHDEIRTLFLEYDGEMDCADFKNIPILCCGIIDKSIEDKL